MRAAVLTGSRQLEVRDIDLPEVPDGHALVRVVGCGVCGSDLHGWNHPELTIVAGDGPLPGFSGHEIVAEPVESPGELVVIEPNRLSACGRCATCLDGAAWFCRDRSSVPSFGFAEQLIVPVASMFPVPEAVSAPTATLVEPLACAIHTVRFSAMADADGRIDGARVAILGAGVTGLLTVAAARHLGAAEVTITARHPHQAAAAAQLGATTVLDAGDADTTASLQAARPTLVIEAVGGRADTLGLAMRIAAPRGEVAVFGLFDGPQSLDVRRASYKELRFFFPITYAVMGGRHDFDVAIALLEQSGGGFDSLVTHTYPLDDIGTAFDTAAAKTSGALRVVVTP